ncbi:hypothetical protein SKAU_G00214600 [Synaphobranchus kaupii]|uniref:Uncharacterized protein n=1 Tax=Synaphobranchus kaupii TaxID=118154 RepID=A0A9Q1F9Z6_SYNKA|nr:hypothetical protein SKAU_G00214600 [Synaphobranchus kaupii]
MFSIFRHTRSRGVSLMWKALLQALSSFADGRKRGPLVGTGRALHLLKGWKQGRFEKSGASPLCWDLHLPQPLRFQMLCARDRYETAGPTSLTVEVHTGHGAGKQSVDPDTEWNFTHTSVTSMKSSVLVPLPPVFALGGSGVSDTSCLPLQRYTRAGEDNVLLVLE